MKDFSSQILEKLNKEYRLASKRSLKPREIWLVIGLCVGIMVGVLYVANVRFEFRSSRATSTIIYQASTQFSGVQGQNRWWYLEWPSGAPLMYQTTNADCGGPCWKGSERYALIASTWMIPGDTTSVVRRWIADQAGTIQITSSGLPNVRMLYTSCGSSADGVTVSINRWQSASNTYGALWSQTLAWNNTTGYAFDLPNIQVVPGDLIDFYVSKGPGNNWCDVIYFDAKILLTTGGVSSSQPDLVVTGIRTEPANPVPGNAVKFYATVQNNGAPVPAGAWVDVFFYVDGTPLVWTGGYPTATPVELGPSFTAWTATAGTHTFKAAIDDDTADQIAESNETNNSFSKQVNITAGTTLSCTGVRGPDSSTQILTSTNKTSGTLDFYAIGVQNAIAVTFPIWTETNGQDDLVWYSGVNQGGGTWKATADLAKHPDAGTTYMHVYMSEGTRWDFCGGIGFTKLALGSGGSGGSTVYQASTGFSSTQGANGWSYTDGNGTLLTYDATNPDCPGCYKGSERYLLMSSNAQNPGQNASAIRRWKAPANGSAHIITGPIQHIGGTCSDGVDVQVGPSVTSATFPASWANPHHLAPGGQDSLDATVSLNAGNTISFIVSKGSASSNNFCDWTQFDPRIEFTPSSGSITMSKTFLEVSPEDTDTQVKIDNNTFMSGNPVIFNNVTSGNHTISVEVPAGVKVFYVICTGNDTCKNDLDYKEGIIGPTVFTLPVFTHSAGVNDGISIIYTPQNAILESSLFTLGNTIRKYAHSAISNWFKDLLSLFTKTVNASPFVQVPIEGIWVNPAFFVQNTFFPCERRIYVADNPGDQGSLDGPGDLYALVKNAINEWNVHMNPKIIFGETRFPQTFDILETIAKNVRTYGNQVPVVVTGVNTYTMGDGTDGANIIGYENPAGKGFGLFQLAFRIPVRGKSYIIASDIGISPSEPFIYNRILFTLGGFIGLGRYPGASVDMSIMGDNQNGYITDNDVQTINTILYPHCAPQPAKLSISLTPNPLGATAAQWQDTSNLAQCGPNGNRINTNGRWAGTLKIQENGGSDIVKLDRKVVKLYTGTTGHYTLKKTFDNSIDWGPFKKGSATSYPFYVLPNSKFIPTRVELTLYGVDQLGNRVESTAAMNLAGGKLLNKTCSNDSGGFPFGGLPIIIEVGGGAS